eukprot:Hpha_TRINITY_DN16209_c1_g16::TRINITY_DN16209_c1_g16_i1::g.13964::m.13964
MAMDLSPPRHRANFDSSHPHAEWAWPCGKGEESTGGRSPRSSAAGGRSPKSSAMKSSVGNTDSVRSSARKVSVSESEPPTMTQGEADRLIGVAGAVLVEGASPGSSPRSAQGQRLYMWWPATLLGRNRDDSYAVEVQQHAVSHRWEKCRLRSLRRNTRVEVDEAAEEDFGEEHVPREEEEQDRELPEMSGQVEMFRVRRKAGVSWGLSLTDGSDGVYITAVHEGSPADAACVPMGKLLQLNGVPVQSLGMCGALRDLTETTLYVLPGLADQHEAGQEEEEEVEEEAEEAAQVQPEARVQHSPRRSIGELSPPRHHGHFDPGHPDADRAWPQDAQPGSSPRGERSLGAVRSSPTSQHQFQDQKRRHLQAMDASSDRRSSVASASSQPREESSQARYAHDKRLHQATVSQRSPRAAPAGDTSPRRQVLSQAEYERAKHLGIHETDDWGRHERRGSNDGRRGSRASDCNELSPPRHSPRFSEHHPHANMAWPSNVQPGSSPRRESASPSPRAASVASTGTVEGGATYEEVEARYGVAGVFEVKGASGQHVWFPATVTGPGTEDGTFSVDVHQFRLVKWHRVLPRSIRWKGGQRPADDDDELM